MNRSYADSRNDFPALDRSWQGGPLAFFDGPAGTQVPRQVIDAVWSYYETSNANTGGAFITSRETDAVIADTRAHMAAFLGAPSADTISFGQNMTTLAFMLSHAFARVFQPGDEVVVTALDHEANRGPWMGLERRGLVIREVGLGTDGRLNYEDFERVVGPKTRLVAVGMASNALGTVNDIRRIAPIVRSSPAWLLLDAVHYAPHLSIDVSAIDADFLFCSAYKFYGPHVGILYAREGLLDSLDTERLITAPQEAPGRIETGTLNHAAIAGVRAAIQYIESWGAGASSRERLVSAMKGFESHERMLAKRYWDGLRAIEGVEIWGPDFSDAERAPTISISIRGMQSDEVARQICDQGCSVWSGHFYAQRAVQVLGLAERGGIVRSGFFLYNTEAEVDRLLGAVETVARRAVKSPANA